MNAEAHAQQVAAHEVASCLESLARIAERVNPFDFVPRDAVTARIVTAGPFHLREPEYEAVIEASRSAFALLANLAPNGEVDCGSVWRVPRAYPFKDLKSDPDWDGISQSVMWDAEGAWLVVVSNEGHGIVAGRQGFTDAVAHRLPDGSDDVVEIVDRLIAARPDTADDDARLMAMVTRLYGTAQAHQIRDHLEGRSP